MLLVGAGHNAPQAVPRWRIDSRIIICIFPAGGGSSRAVSCLQLHSSLQEAIKNFSRDRCMRLYDERKSFLYGAVIASRTTMIEYYLM